MQPKTKEAFNVEAEIFNLIEQHDWSLSICLGILYTYMIHVYIYNLFSITKLYNLLKISNYSITQTSVSSVGGTVNSDQEYDNLRKIVGESHEDCKQAKKLFQELFATQHNVEVILYIYIT